MKLFCMESRKERNKRLAKWHKWFAWRPVAVEIGARECIFWLCYVQRRDYGWRTWEYKL